MKTACDCMEEEVTHRLHKGRKIEEKTIYRDIRRALYETEVILTLVLGFETW